MARSGWKLSDETKAKMSASMIGNKNGLGHRWTEEEKQAMSLAKRGVRLSEETKKKLSEAAMGKRKGIKLSEETKRRMSEAQKGNKHNLGHKASLETRQKLSAAQRNRILSEEAKQKISEAVSEANRNRVISDETRQKMSVAHKGAQPLLGYKHTEESKKKTSESLKGRFAGENNWNWKGGISTAANRLRNSPEYRDWRKLVYSRDNFTCALCGDRGDCLHAHHIKKVSSNPDLIFDVDNGITLHETCHKKIRGEEDKYIECFTDFVSQKTGGVLSVILQN